MAHKKWLAIASTKQPNGEIKRSLHLVQCTPLVVEPAVQIFEDEDGIQHNLCGQLDSPDLMLLIAPGAENWLPFSESLDLVTDLVHSEFRARDAGETTARQMLEELAGDKGNAKKGSDPWRHDIIEAGAQWLRTGIKPAPKHPPVLLHDEEE